MGTQTLVRQQRLITRARGHAATARDATDLLAHDDRVAQNRNMYGGGQAIADRSRADDVHAVRDEARTPPGWRTFVGVALIAGALISVIQMSPHGGRWDAQLVVAGAIVLSGFVWLVCYGLFALHRRGGRTSRAAVLMASPTIGCGDPNCPLEPCATFLLDPGLSTAAADLDTELRALHHAAAASPLGPSATGSEIVHRPAPACPDCIASVRLDPRQAPGMVGIITVHQPSCPYFRNALAVTT